MYNYGGVCIVIDYVAHDGLHCEYVFVVMWGEW
jgi:hypothetical protein